MVPTETIKVRVLKTKIQFLGRIVNVDGLHKEPEKVRDVIDVSRP